MALRLGKKDAYRWPVTLRMPVDGGVYDEVGFTAVFNRLAQKDIDAMGEASMAGSIDDADVVAKVLAGWDDVKDEQGNALAFSPENVAAVLDGVAGARAAIVRAFFESAIGGARKN